MLLAVAVPPCRQFAVSAQCSKLYATSRMAIARSVSAKFKEFHFRSIKSYSVIPFFRYSAIPLFRIPRFTDSPEARTLSNWGERERPPH